MKIGYARVSSRDQNLDMQLVALTDAGCEKIFEEKVSGVGERLELQAALQFLREGDCLVVYKLDRLGRSMRDLLNIMADLERRRVGVISLKDGIDASSTSGRLIMHIFAALAEFERSLIAERTADGRAAAKAAGKRFGRPKNSNTDKAKACTQLYKSGMTVPQIQEQLGIKSKSTVYRFLRQSGVEPNRIKTVN